MQSSVLWLLWAAAASGGEKSYSRCAGQSEEHRSPVHLIPVHGANCYKVYAPHTGSVEDLQAHTSVRQVRSAIHRVLIAHGAQTGCCGGVNGVTGL